MMTTDRNVFVGGYVTQDVKEALQAEAASRRISCSRLIYELLCDVLHIVPKEEKR